MSDLSSIIEIERLKAEIERLKAIYDHDSAAICEKHAEIKMDEGPPDQSR
jgi:hypothetical protein